MTAKEKATKLYDEYEQLVRDFTIGVSIKEFAKQSALTAVAEILVYFAWEKSAMKFWQEVKTEIEKL